MGIAEKLKQSNNIYFLLIVLFGFILYGNSLFNDYALDDAIVITKNSFTKKGISGIGDILTHDGFTGFFGKDKQLVAGGRYRPLSLVTFAIEYQFFGDNPFISHLINIILYILTAILLFLILAEFFPDSIEKNKFLNIPFVVTLLFLFHPIHTEAIANIKGRDEIMTLLGSLYTLYLSLKYIKTEKLKYLIYTIIVFFLALMSKENAITFVAIIPLSVYYFTKAKFKLNFRIIIALLSATVVYMIIRTSVIGFTLAAQSTELMNDPYINSIFIEKMATNFYTMGLYLKLLFFPHPLTFDYYPKQIPIMGFGDFRAIISMLIYLFIGIVAILGFKKKTVVSYGIWFYILSFSVVSNVVFNVGTFMNERFVYISSIGFLIVIVFLLFKYLYNKNEKVLYALLILVLLGFSIKTISRNRAWENDYVLFTTDVYNSPNSAKSNTSAGGKLLETVGQLKAILHDKPTNIKVIIKKLEKTNLRSSEVDDLIIGGNIKSITENINKKIKEMQQLFLKYLEKAVKIHPTYSDALILLGNAYYDIDKNVDKSWSAYERILKRNPNYERVYTNMDIILNDSVDVDTRIKLWTELKKYKPARFNTNYQLGHLYGMYKNNLDTAIYFISVALNTDKTKAEAWKDLGVAYGIKATIKRQQYGQDSAKVYFLKALNAMNESYKYKPEDVQLLSNIASTYMNLNDFNNAVIMYERALKINQNSPEIRTNLYRACVSAKQFDKAREYLLVLVKSNPENFFLNFDFASICKQLGRVEEANFYFNKAYTINPKLYAQYFK